MVATGTIPNGFTYSYVLSACARSGMVREGEQIHRRVLVHGYFSNVFVRTNLINLYAIASGGDDTGYAHKVFDEMGAHPFGFGAFPDDGSIDLKI
ncbi:hypothetical protein F3Y22_tig00110637pilonHSYRG00499 [Hibiscus syriacus]|uniref:Pentatricopeptide repeat-containing protein n=1 Tax=Hibiscus syriacus TaxID=106335 RepID=A0A6A2ZY91_HIBSY|nr:hypothetical protein F3Y22_tig00110637pilonHSYRG00499 [Hibiscus syriacus]